MRRQLVDITPTREVLFEKFYTDVAVCNFIMERMQGCRIKKYGNSVFFIMKYTIWFELDYGQFFISQKLFLSEFERLFPEIFDEVIENKLFSDVLKEKVLKKYDIEYSKEIIFIGDWLFDLYERTRAGLVPNKNLIKF